MLTQPHLNMRGVGRIQLCKTEMQPRACTILIIFLMSNHMYFTIIPRALSQ